jgi:hypothetical protein
MCYEYERLYWLERAAQALREKEKAEESKKKEETRIPARPDTPGTRIEEGDPVPV